MHLENRPLQFSNITHHASVTQCLGSIGGHVWYLGIAKPSIVDSNEITGKKVVQSRSGHFYVPPAIEDVQIFKVSGSKFLKLNRGTWHAGPLFKSDTMDFYNLELNNTNVSFSPSLALFCCMDLNSFAMLFIGFGSYRLKCVLLSPKYGTICFWPPKVFVSFWFISSENLSSLVCSIWLSRKINLETIEGDSS